MSSGHCDSRCCYLLLLFVILRRQPQLVIIYAFEVEVLHCFAEWEGAKTAISYTVINSENLTAIPQRGATMIVIP